MESEFRPVSCTTKIITLPVIVQTSKRKSKSKLKSTLWLPGMLDTQLPKEKKQRVITQTKRWNDTVQESDFTKAAQMTLLKDIYSKVENGWESKEQDKKSYFLCSEIRKKMSGYKSQDIIKEKYDESKFVELNSILQLLVDSNLQCYYCREDMFVWYETSREPKQWTLERIQNEQGHNYDNVQICCLSCNISRRCMYHEKYRFTKQLSIEKSGYREVCKVEQEQEQEH